MSTLTIVKAINRKVLNLWRNEFSDRAGQVRCPLQYSELDTEGVLFVGCNPALPKRNHYDVPYLANVLERPDSIDYLIKEERKARDSYPYYVPCHEIAAKLIMPWAHVDWFFQRGTSQRELEDEVTESSVGWNEPVELSKFARAQINLSKQLMDACQPKMVLVANAFAAKIAKSEFKLETVDQHGLLWGILGGRRIPFFLSGMLTGQRALDRGSRERLEWHMGKAKALIKGGIA